MGSGRGISAAGAGVHQMSPAVRAPASDSSQVQAVQYDDDGEESCFVSFGRTAEHSRAPVLDVRHTPVTAPPPPRTSSILDSMVEFSAMSMSRLLCPHNQSHPPTTFLLPMVPDTANPPMTPPPPNIHIPRSTLQPNQ